MSMSDETTTTHERHERMTETRSWSEYDEDSNVTADHTTVREICGTCYRERFGRRGHLEYVSADWPCDGAENARLRDRVAALEGAGEKMHDALWAYWFPRGANPDLDEAGRQAIKAWRLALLQADERQGGER